MAAPVDKIDLSLDDIIKLNKKKQRQQQQATGGRGKKKGAGGQSKAQGKGKGKGKGQQRQTGGGKSPAATSTPASGVKVKGRGQRAQRLKQKAKKTLQKTPAKQQATPTKPVSGVKLRLGIIPGRGRGRGVSTPGRGKPASVNRPGSAGRPGSKLKALRALKSERGKGRRGGGAAGRELLKQSLAGRGRGKKKQQGTPRTPASPDVFHTPVTSTVQQITTPISSGGTIGAGRHGRRRGLRGKALRGRGGGVAQDRTASIAVISPSQFEPVGVNIPMILCAEQHTSKSLHNRFTPRMEQRPAQRLVQRGGRTVNLHS